MHVGHSSCFHFPFPLSDTPVDAPAVASSLAPTCHTQAEAASVKDVTPINAWAAKATNYLIPEVLPPGFEFNMALTNAVYFKGMWEYAFDKSKTQLKQFKALGKDGSNKVRRRRWGVGFVCEWEGH